MYLVIIQSIIRQLASQLIQLLTNCSKDLKDIKFVHETIACFVKKNRFLPELEIEYYWEKRARSLLMSVLMS